MTVREPSQYEDALIEGTISRAQSRGRVSGRSEMTFNLERIRTSDGRTYSFAGIVEGVRTAEGGGDVRVDNVGSVREGESQTQKTVERAAIGTAIGAIIGAIAGGGKGAGIGAVLGAGGGAGSVYAQGRDELELRRGTEVTIRASGPSRGMTNER
jgi:outer membrane lipoprotein SlyB